MFEFYPQIKFVHIACVVHSGCLFALRGTMLILDGSQWVHHPILRRTTYLIDTTLLAVSIAIAHDPRSLFARFVR